MRWRLIVSEFKFDIVHRAGIKNHAADALSQSKTAGMDLFEPDDDLTEIRVSLVTQPGEKVNDDYK